MPRDEMREKRIKDVSVTKLLDEFTDSDTPFDLQKRTDMSDEEYAQMMVTKEIERKLLRTRINPTANEGQETVMEEYEELLEIPEGSCPSCYYCTIIRRIGEAVYCVCANPDRAVDGMYHDHRMWVRSESDLECHRESPMIKAQKQIRQHIEERQQEQVMNESPVKTSSEESFTVEPVVMNLFEELLERVEEEPDIEDPDIPDVGIRPPDFRKKPVPEETETLIPVGPQTPGPRNEAIDAFFREETIAVHRHKALRTLEKYRRERPMKLTKREESPIVSERLAPMRKCENCYFCVGNKQVGGSSWCHCTNLARSTDTTIATSWVRSRLNASCWRKEEPL